MRRLQRRIMADKKTIEDLLEDEIKDHYSAEKQRTNAIPKAKDLTTRRCRRRSGTTSRKPKAK
jgi:ferritin-like metal-binding protein YciE